MHLDEYLIGEINNRLKILERQGAKLVKKLWGYEEWIVNNDKYCGKILYLFPGAKSSLHYHIVKHETFMALEGMIIVEVDRGDEFELVPLRGWAHDSITLPPDTLHRFWAPHEPAVIVEFSTMHDDADTVRLENSAYVR